MEEVFAHQTNERIEKQGTKFVTGGSGDYVLKGQITEWRYPKKGAAWGGWIGAAAGSGTIVYDWTRAARRSSPSITRSSRAPPTRWSAA